MKWANRRHHQLVFILDNCTQYTVYDRGVSLTKPVMSCQLDTSELVELLQQSAVEHLTKFRQLEAREFPSIVLCGLQGRVITTDFEALYAYKCGEYQRCFQLSTYDTRTWLAGDTTSFILSCQEFIQLMDDDISSLIGLTLIVNASCRDNLEFTHIAILQLSLSLYLMSQCQMKLHHSACLLYTSPSPRDGLLSRMPSSA